MPKEAAMYEAMYILDPGLEPAQVEEIEERLKAGIASAGGTFEAVHDFGRRRLAYRIRGHADGAYRVMYFRGDGNTVRELNHEYAIIEEIIRGHVVQANPKYTLGNLPKPEPPRGMPSRGDEGSGRGPGGPRPPRTEEREPVRRPTESEAKPAAEEKAEAPEAPAEAAAEPDAAAEAPAVEAPAAEAPAAGAPAAEAPAAEAPAAEAPAAEAPAGDEANTEE